MQRANACPFFFLILSLRAMLTDFFTIFRGQLCTDLEEVIQAQYHQQIFAVLIPTLEVPEPRCFLFYSTTPFP